MQPIADAGFGEDERGIGGLVAELVAELVDRDAQIVRLVRGVWPPDFLEQLAVCDYLSMVLGQPCQQAVLGRREMCFLPRDEHSPGGQIDRQITGCEDLRAGRLVLSLMP